MLKVFLLTAVCGLLTAGPGAARTGSGLVPEQAGGVIDDAEWEAKFVAALVPGGRPVTTMTGREARESLAASAGKKVTVVRADGSGPAPSMNQRARENVVVVGSVGKCGACDDWHLNGVGTGWMISADGVVATSYHVLEDDDEALFGIMTSDGQVWPVREVLAADADGDAVLVRGDFPEGARRGLDLAATVEDGAPVRVLSHPDGRFYSWSEGIVARRHLAPAEDGMEKRVWLTITADYGAGSSGAPVLDGNGDVVGMVSSTAVLLADSGEEMEPAPEDVQMVFRDCVSLETIRGLLAE
jgi:serine protease Do